MTYRTAMTCVLFCANVVLATTASAQDAPLLVDRGRIDRPSHSQAPTPSDAPPAPAGRGRIETPAAAPGTFQLTSVQLEGARSIAPDMLAAAWRPQVGTQVGVQELNVIAQRIGQAYVTAGYPLYSVQIPAQDFAGGVARVVVTEGYVEGVLIDGDTAGGNLDLLKQYAARIVAERPLTRPTLVRYILLMNDIPGLKVGSRFEPGTAPGGTTLRLTIERKDYELASAVTNQGSAALARYQFTVAATAYSALQQGDRTSLIYGFPINFRDFGYYGLSHLQPVGSDGATVGLDASYLRTRQSGSPVTGDAQTASLKFAMPLIRQTTENLFANLSFDVLNSENAVLGQTVSNERTRVLRAGMTYTISAEDGSATTSFNATVSKGFDALGARAGFGGGLGGPSFTKATLRVDHERVLFENFIGRARAAAQLAGETLPASEQFTYGGEDFGRGFRAAEMTGDRGIEAGLELAWRIPPAWTSDVAAGSELFVFYDAARILAFTPLLATPGTGQSVGAGIRLQLFRKINLVSALVLPVQCTRLDTVCDSWRGTFSFRASY